MSMKYLSYLFLLITLFSNLSAGLYTDSLSSIITQKIQALEQSPYEVKNIEKIERKLARNIQKQPSAQDLIYFLDQENSVILFFNDQVTLKLNGDLSQEAMHTLEDFKDLKFAINAKLYLYYLTCCKENMLYNATKNYDALQYWKNELFAENLAFYNKNILRWISRSSYQERIERNIANLEKVTFETNSFLGMLCSNQDLLLQSESEQDFKDNLKEVIAIQNELLHVADDLSYDDMGNLLVTSLKQVHEFNDHLSELYAQCQLPSHVARNWKAYTISTATMCACAYIYFHYGDAIVEGCQRLWSDHIENPVRQLANQVTGYAQPPQFPTEQSETFKKGLVCHQEKLKAFVEAGVKLPPARGEDVSLHEALVKDFDAVTDGEFSAKFKKIDDKMVEMDDIVKKVNPMIEKMTPVVDLGNDLYKRYETYKAEHPNALWSDFLSSWSDPAFPDAYQNGRTWKVAIQRKISDPGVDLTTPLPGVQISNKKIPVPPLTPLDLQDQFQQASGELGQAIQAKSSLDQETAPDSSSWTFEEKQAYVEKQHVTILTYPYKNLLRIPQAYAYKIEDESLRGKQALDKEIVAAKEVGNKVLKDNHMVMCMATLIPAATVVGGSLFASKNIYNSVAYQPIRKFVRELEVLLNDALYRQPSFDVQGKLYFFVEQLALNIDVLTLGEQKMIQEDLASLRNYGLDYVQKYNVIQRMYKTYPCLSAGGA